MEARSPNSESRVLPSGSRPVARQHPRQVAVVGGPGAADQASVPWRVGMPGASTLSFSNVGTPAK